MPLSRCLNHSTLILNCCNSLPHPSAAIRRTPLSQSSALFHGIPVPLSHRLKLDALLLNSCNSQPHSDALRHTLLSESLGLFVHSQKLPKLPVADDLERFDINPLEHSAFPPAKPL